MNTKDEEYMIALDSCRSLTHAAEKLHVTQPALSIFLSRLESSLDMPLFEREGKRLIPTPGGKAYLKYAHQVMALKRDFEQETLDLKKEQKGQLHIGCLEKRSNYLMPRLMHRFQKRYPGIEVSLHTNHPEELFLLLLNGEVDLVYANRDPHQPEFNNTRIRSDHLLLVLPERHPAAAHAHTVEGKHFPYLDLKYVEQEPFYVLPPGYSIRFLVEDAIQFSHIRPKCLNNIATIDLGCQMAAEGLGVSFTMETYSQNIACPTPHQYFLTGNPDVKTTWRIFWRKSMELSLYMLGFVDMLREMERENISR